MAVQYLAPPTIRCAELAAATKAFLEMHYYNIHTHYENLAQDPTHLRRLRALKTKGTSTTMQCPYMRTNLRLERPLGKGSFGLVELVKEVTTGRVYAMKIMHKPAMINNGQEAHLKCERDLLVEFAKRESNWIVPLIQSFQDRDNLYLVMSFMEGGDFLGLLLRDEVLTEEDTRFYIGEMICAVEEVHKMGWIHRDLKPDNFLIDGNGHLKLSDFGLAFSPHWAHQMAYYANTRAHMCERLGFEVYGDGEDTPSTATNSANTYAYSAQYLYQQPTIRAQGTNMSDILFHRRLDTATFHHLHTNTYKPTITDEISRNECALWRRGYARSCVGTSQYMAPEVIAGERYDKACDWWSIGCILYECLFGSTPFYDNSREKVKFKACNFGTYYKAPRGQRVQRPHTENPLLLEPVRGEVRNLMRQLICRKDQRLNIERIKRHPWFTSAKGFEWDMLRYQRAPWVPERRRPEDIACYFEPEDQIGPMEGKYKRPRDKVLRDPVCGPAALDVRKQTAFLGYTFRKSDFVGWGSLAARERTPSPSLLQDVAVQVGEGRAESLQEMEAMQWIESANAVVKEMNCGPAVPVTLSAF